MGFRDKGKAFFALVILMAATGCGDLDLLFPQSESYHVKAMINGNSLEDCSLIWATDEIRPYFADSVENDPDLTGLLVYIQNSKGEIIGDKVLYSLQIQSDEAETPKDTAIEADPAELSVREQVGHRGVREKWGFINTKPIETDAAIVIAVRSLDQEIPPFPLPENMEIGPYSLVFEAIGKKETLCHTESEIFFLGNTEFSIKDISMYLPSITDARLIPPGTTILIESNLEYDSRLEPYLIWYDGKTIIAEGKISEGAGNILWKAPDRAGFYSLGLEVFPFKLRGHFTGVFREIALPVSSKATDGVKGYFFGEGPEYAANCPLSAGTIFPELKLAEIDQDENPEAENPPVMIEHPELLRWYQFEGSLDDTTAWSDTERSLIPAGEKAVLWSHAGQSYGLSTGPQDAYLLSPISFFRNAQVEGGGIFLFHFKSPAEGTIFSAFFPMQTSADEGLKMEVLKKRNTIVLRLETGETVTEIPVYLPPFESRTFIPAAVEFYIRPYRMEAKLSLEENQSMQSAEGNIRLSGALAGEGRIKLGGGAAPEGDIGYLQQPAEDEGTAENIPAEENYFETMLGMDDIEPGIIQTDEETETHVLTGEESGKKEIPVNTVWNEFAVLYSSLAIQEEEIFPDLFTEIDIEITEAGEKETQETITEASAGTAVVPAAETWNKVIRVEVDRVYLTGEDLTALDTVLPDLPSSSDTGDFSLYDESESPNASGSEIEAGARIHPQIPVTESETDGSAEDTETPAAHGGT